VVAAFTAAVLSLVNVAISARLASRGSREQWRREQERPLVARAITLSADARRAWWDISVARQRDGAGDVPIDSEDHPWRKGWRVVEDLRYQVAELDLLASTTVREFAHRLVAAHEQEAAHLVLRPRQGENDSERRQGFRAEVQDLEAELVERTRADLGLAPGLQVPHTSLLGRSLGRGRNQKTR
jgi:hypothetical protein